MNHLSEIPIKVRLDKPASVLLIGWKDGVEHTFSLEVLRKACPCASCRGGHDQMGGDLDPMLFSLPTLTTWAVSHIETVGHHALRIFWSDGHNDGMFGWGQLRALGNSIGTE